MEISEAKNGSYQNCLIPAVLLIVFNALEMPGDEEPTNGIVQTPIMQTHAAIKPMHAAVIIGVV